METRSAEPVSVVIPTYNRAHLIQRAVRSVLEQPLTESDELIVIDDGSTDNTEQVLSPFIGKIQYFRKENRGAGAARNTGISCAKHDLIAFLDSDDEWLPGKLRLQRAFMSARPDIVMCFTDFLIQTLLERRHHGLDEWREHEVRSWDDVLGSKSEEFNGLECWVGNLYLHQMYFPYVPTFTAMVRRSLAGPSLRIPEDLQLYEDWVLFGELARLGPAAYLNVESTINHGHEGSRLTDADHLLKTTTRLKVLERVWGRDADFQSMYRAEYRDLYKQIRLRRLRCLIARGDTKQAREEIERARGDVPLSYKALALLPGPAARSVTGLRREVRERLVTV